MLTIFKANQKNTKVLILNLSLFNIFKIDLLQSLLDRVPYGEGQVQDLSLTFGESELIDIHETVSLCLRRELHAVSEQVILRNSSNGMLLHVLGRERANIFLQHILCPIRFYIRGSKCKEGTHYAA